MIDQKLHQSMWCGESHTVHAFSSTPLTLEIPQTNLGASKKFCHYKSAKIALQKKKKFVFLTKQRISNNYFHSTTILLLLMQNPVQKQLGNAKFNQYRMEMGFFDSDPPWNVLDKRQGGHCLAILFAWESLQSASLAIFQARDPSRSYTVCSDTSRSEDSRHGKHDGLFKEQASKNWEHCYYTWPSVVPPL